MTDLVGRRRTAGHTEPARSASFVMLGLMLSMFVSALSQTVLSTALPTIVGDLGGLRFFSFVISASMLASTIATPIFGKLGDLHGRARVFEVALCLFLLGSALSGLAQSIWQLVGFRALQAVGGGGLYALSQAIIGDLVPPRSRGRYAGYLGAVWGVTTILGPLIGGFLVDNLSWRWCFYAPLPIGVGALAVTRRLLSLPSPTTKARIDYGGAALLSGLVATFMLAMLWGGSRVAWVSPSMGVLAGIVATFAVAFVVHENRAKEPLLPPRVFAAPSVRVALQVGFLTGMSLFGALTYVPAFLQVVSGSSATDSGLVLVPLMLGVVGAMIASGWLVSRTGRYKIFPLFGTATMCLGLFAFSTVGSATPRTIVGAELVLLGVGLGSFMQVLIVAIQNVVEKRDLGIATAAHGFFLQMGGAIGIAGFGALLNGGIAQRLTISVGTRVDLEALLGSPAAIHALPPPTRRVVVDAFATSIHSVFRVSAVLAALAFVVAWRLEEHPLRSDGAGYGTDRDVHGKLTDEREADDARASDA